MKDTIVAFAKYGLLATLIAALYINYMWIVYLTILLIAFCIYKLLVIPYLKHSYFSKYKNVYTGEFVPFLGVGKHFIEAEKKGSVFYEFLMNQSQIFKGYDMVFLLFGTDPILEVVSHQAQKEFDKLVPTKIDRMKYELMITKMALDGFGNTPTSDYLLLRKKTYLKSLNINVASQYIPDIIENLEEQVNSWKSGGTYDFFDEMNHLMFTIFQTILLGKDIIHLTEQKRNFCHPDSSVTQMKFGEYFMRIHQSYLEEVLEGSAALFPFLSHYNLIEPFKRNKTNLDIFHAWLKEIIAASNDKNAIIYQMKSNDQLTPYTIFNDIIGLMMASIETTSHSLTSAMYYLKKYPQTLVTLQEELLDNGYHKYSDNKGMFDRDKILEMEYLNCVVKEALRVDGPATQSLYYHTLEDVTICGVKIPKGTTMVYGLTPSNHSHDEWIEPRKFIPERFNPNSEYFNNPNSDKARSPYAFAPFSHGFRSCPGQSLAILEMKVILTYILSKLDYSIDQTQLDRDDIGFGFASKIKLGFTVTKI